MPYTDDPVRDAEVFYLHKELNQHADEFDARYKENLEDFSMFQSFLHDLDTDNPTIKLFFEQMYGDQIDKCYAYDNLIILYESYIKEVTEMLND